MPLECLAQKNVSPLAEPELDRVTIAVDSRVEISPLPTNLDVSFVDKPLGIDVLLELVEVVQELRRVADNPPVNGRVINLNAALGHHFLKMA